MKKILLLLVSMIALLEGKGHGGGHRGHRGGRGGRHHAGHGHHGVKHGYGHRGYGRRGYGRGGWYGGWGWSGFPWAFGWIAGSIGASMYRYLPSQEAIRVVYNNYYPYWGYGLGLERRLDDMARQNRWDEIKALLLQQRQQVQQQLNQARAQHDQQKIDQLEDTLNKIQLHINGLTSRATS